MEIKVVKFEDLEQADLHIDCIYKGGTAPNISAEPFHKLIPGCENSGGFRKKLREDGSGKYAYVEINISINLYNSFITMGKETLSAIL